MKENENKSELKKYWGSFMTGFAMSKAILEDYAKVISKIEGVEEKEVQERIIKRTREIFTETKEEIQKG
jgi:hypothetical protein